VISSGLASLILISIFLHFYNNPTLDKHGSKSESSFFIPYLSGFASFMCIMIFIERINTLMKIYLAPKYFLIDLIMTWK